MSHVLIPHSHYTCLTSYRTDAEFSEPRVHGFVYEPRSGEVKRLNINFDKHEDEISGVYDLYPASASA
jgi:carbonic anhydrase